MPAGSCAAKAPFPFHAASARVQKRRKAGTRSRREQSAARRADRDGPVFSDADARAAASAETRKAMSVPLPVRAAGLIPPQRRPKAAARRRFF